MTEKNQTNPQEWEGGVWDAIAAFEQILQTIPDDRTAVDALATAYEQLGDLARAGEYLARLARMVVAEADHAAAPGVLERIKKFRDASKEIQEAAAQLEALMLTVQETPNVTPVAKAAPASAGLRTILTEEMDLAWALQEGGQLSQDEYAMVIQDLTDLSSMEGAVHISTLHVVAARFPAKLNDMLVFVAGKAGVPIIPLPLFDSQPEALSPLPIEYMVRRGVIPFERMGNELLVAVLNPLGRGLKQEVEALAGQKIHLNLVSPADFDSAIDALRERLVQPPADTPPPPPSA
jgi:tetratricopeptide (TPR) repeat protein